MQGKPRMKAKINAELDPETGVTKAIVMGDNVALCTLVGVVLQRIINEWSKRSGKPYEAEGKALCIVAEAMAAADDHEALIGLRTALNGLAAKAHAALDALPAADRADDRTILTDLARSIISDARVYGVDSALPPSKRRQPKGETVDG